MDIHDMGEGVYGRNLHAHKLKKEVYYRSSRRFVRLAGSQSFGITELGERCEISVGGHNLSTWVLFEADL